ncbi:MAG: TolC family protein [Chlamydiae bacterium]|nr:TolC family protein [Chlamydiota bacterium]
MKVHKIIPCFTLILALQGCSPKPPEVTFDPPLPDQFRENNQFITTSQSQVDLSFWWEQFNDPLLDDLIEEALKLNFDAQLAYEKINEIRCAYRISKWKYAPSGGMTGFAQRIRRSDDLLRIENPLKTSNATIPTTNIPFRDIPFDEIPFDQDDFIPRYQNFLFLGFDASWEIDVFGRIASGKKAAWQTMQVAIENARDVQVIVIAEVARQYVEILALQERIQVAKSFITSQKEILGLAEDLFNAGLASDTDKTQAKALLDTAQASLPPLENGLKQSIYQLAFLLGRMPQDLFERLAEKKELFSAHDKVPVGIPSDLLRRRADVRRAERELQAAHTKIWIAKTDIFPRFFLTGAIGRLADSGHALLKDENTLWAFGPYFTWPILDMGKILANVDAKTSQQKQALINYEKTVISSLKDVETSLVGYGEENERYKYLNDQVNSEKKLLKLSLELFQSGLTNFTDVLQQEATLLTNEDTLVQSKEQVVLNLIALYKALGGGWEVNTKAIGAKTIERAHFVEDKVEPDDTIYYYEEE